MMKKYLVLIAMLMISPVFAQQFSYSPLSQAQWESMDRDIHKQAMQEETHQIIHNIMNAYLKLAAENEKRVREEAEKSKNTPKK